MIRLGDNRARLLITAVAMCAVVGVIALAHKTGLGWKILIVLPILTTAIAAYVNPIISLGKERGLSRSTRTKALRLAPVYRATTEALAHAIAAKDSYEQHHVRRVQSICRLIAWKMCLSTHEIDGIEVAAMLHDVGKLGVPEYILLKPGPLDPDEFSKMANHAKIGADILEKVNFPWNITEMIRHHHERYDGSGYPDHLVGDQIPLGARIIAVAEVYDALVSDRCYKTRWSHQQAVEHIEKLSCSHFDPRVVKAFLKAESEIDTLLANETPALDSSCRDSQHGSCAAAAVIAQANRELLSLLEIAETLSSTLELDEVLAILAHRTRRLIEAATCVVFLVDESDPRELVARAVVGRHEGMMIGARARLGKGVTGKAAARLKPYLGSYDPNDLIMAVRNCKPPDIRSCLVAPMTSFGKLLGTINLYDESPRAFSSEDLRKLTSIASRAAIAVQNASAFESVRDSAMKDPLTGLYNARYLRNYLEHEVSRAARRGERLSVIGLDLENFKSVNDSFGHARGDEVLKDVATVFLRQLRDYDLVVRIGGDEFVVVLPGATGPEAARTASRIQDEVDVYARRNLPNTPLPLGISVGIATYPDDATDIDNLLAEADASMYRNKRDRKQLKTAA
ncbi:MAG: diguanylate cyclase [Armatimonadetes bacterium]|nr:diguanylate cyclase [Armatimonadota bacterium]